LTNPVPTGFLNLNAPMVTEEGLVTPAWQRFFQSLFTAAPSTSVVLYPSPGAVPQGWVSLGGTLGGVAAPVGYQWMKRQ
jgi:hypothetical protein